MKWQGHRQSENVEDRRGKSYKKVGGGIGIGTLIILALVLLLGGDPSQYLNQIGNQQGQVQQVETEYKATKLETQLDSITRVTLAKTEDVWSSVFRDQLNKTYRKPTLVMFDRYTTSSCGAAQSATGPFYCPADQKIYIDLSFYNELAQRFRASGDFAFSYVVAHEVAHHVQHQLGITQQVHSKKGRISEEAYNDLSVRLELQADFLAGVWARYVDEGTNLLESGDIEEAIRAAQAIGDDRIQKQSQGYVVPESFTHGTSEQRVRWFTKGYKTADINQGDTFNARTL